MGKQAHPSVMKALKNGIFLRFMTLRHTVASCRSLHALSQSIFDWTYFKSGSSRGKVALSHPERNVDQADEGRDFYERAYDADKRLP